ncbi:ATP-binding protein [Streptomyces violaceusniger]|uniref:ATP-binding protein n=1 Tax=Streptomyces violaceusniger TaxID=68280 RepID=UPI0009973CF7|nr:ATP-binding protein [Streptomyces hygroscopicus]AQW52438.1 ATP-binding region ATPase domain protein [Streptomyces hygroscopicus]
MGAHAHPELPHRYTLSAPALPISPRLCRDFVRGIFAASGLPQLAEAAALCTSELVTNVHRHGKGDVRMAATIRHDRIRVAVHDDSPELPSPRRAAFDETNGRGLFLVTALSDVCGMTYDEAAEGTGKSVWFEFNVPPANTKSTA